MLLRLDYLSCVLTIVSTILVGRRCWEGWILAAINSVVVCLIGFRTAQFGFIPANVFCIGLYVVNLRAWRKPETQDSSKERSFGSWNRNPELPGQARARFDPKVTNQTP